MGRDGHGDGSGRVVLFVWGCSHIPMLARRRRVKGCGFDSPSEISGEAPFNGDVIVAKRLIRAASQG